MLPRVFAIALALCLSGCSTIVQMVDTPKPYATTITIPLKRTPQNFIEAASQMGTSLGYIVSGTDLTKNAVQLSDDESLGMGVLIGKVRRISVTLTLEPGGRQMKIELQLFGNFDQATQAAAEGRLAQLKMAVAGRFD